MPSLDLTVYDKGCIEMEEGLLTDKHMLAASKLLKREFPGLQGLQSTLLSETDGFLQYLWSKMLALCRKVSNLQSCQSMCCNPVPYLKPRSFILSPNGSTG